MPASNVAGVPKYIVKYCQTRSLKDSVSQLVAAVQRLQLPPHADFLKWRRSRAAAAAAMRRVPQSSAPSLLATLAEQAPASSIATFIAAVLGAFVLHALAFACFASLARVCRSSSRRSGSLQHRSMSPPLKQTGAMPPAERASPTTVMMDSESE